MKRFLLLLLAFISLELSAQDDGFINYMVSARFHGTNDATPGATVTIYSDTKEVHKLTTDKNGRIKVELDYGHKYKVVFTKAGYVSSYMLLDANIPAKKKEIISGFEQSVYFIDRAAPKNVDTVRYKHPFTRWAFDLKENKFTEDLSYLQEFASGIFKDDILAKEQAKKEADLKAAKDKAALDKKEAERKRHEAMRLADKKKTKITGKLLSGDAGQKAILNTKVYLVNSTGKTIETTTTNQLGGFVFTQTSGDENYGIVTEIVNPKHPAGEKLSLINKDAKQMALFGKDIKGKFDFRLLASDTKILTEMKVDDADLRVDIQGKIMKSEKNGQPMANLKINYVDEDGNIIVSTTTDAAGKFKFKGLSYDAFYLFAVNVADGQLKDGEKIVLTDLDGNVVHEITNEDAKSKYRFEIVPAESNEFANVYYNDPWLQLFDANKLAEGIKTMTIKEKVYFNSAEAVLLPEAKRKLDGVIHVMENVPGIVIELSSHTDSKGSDDYNMNLSQKRAKSAHDYILAHGIPEKRITSKGYGETSLINKCANGVECTEEEHAQNRRLEFKITIQ